MQPLTIPSGRAVPARAGSLAAVVLLAGLTGCGRTQDVSRAARGSIDRHAPVQTTARITIGAPVAVVWKTLSGISRWPAWQPDIQATSIAAPAAAGVAFAWATSGGTIHSRIVLFEPEHRLAWIGHVLAFRAIHVWELASLSAGETVVTTTESLSGWPIGWLYSANQLHEADQHWLGRLKTESERVAATRGQPGGSSGCLVGEAARNQDAAGAHTTTRPEPAPC